MNYQFQFDAIFAARPLLLKGNWITVPLSLIATVLGLLVAIFCAWGETSGPGWSRFVIDAYIEVIRNTPFGGGNARRADRQQRNLPAAHRVLCSGAIYFVICWPLSLLAARMVRKRARALAR